MAVDIISLLIIEDEEHSNAPVVKALEQANYEVISFSQQDVSNLMLLLGAHKWDLLIADIDASGFELDEILAIIQQSNSDVPLIITGQTITEDYSIKAMEAGAQDYFSKNNINRLVPIAKRELRNISKLRQHSETVTRNEILNYILENSANEVYLIDPITTKFEFANKTLINNLQYTEVEIFNIDKDHIIPPDHIDRVHEIMTPLLQGLTSQVSFQSTRMRKDGTTYPVEVHLEEIKQSGQRYLLGIAFDISQQLMDAATIKKQKEETRKLELNSKYKSEFFANLSHEMRTTLNSVSLLSQILLENEPQNLTAEQLDYAELISRSNISLLELLNEVLDLSKIEAGKISIKLQDVGVGPLCEQLQSVFKPIAREKKILLELDENETAPAFIKTDHLRLEQILKNLLSNALKFTHQGFIRMKVYKPDQRMVQMLNLQTSDIIAIQVKDTGIGIPDHKQRMIFQSYAQANGGDTEQRFGGTGLGLAISQKLAHILGGKLMLDSEVGNGSTFTLYLPENSSNAVKREAKKGNVTIQKAIKEAGSRIKDQKISKKPEKQGTVLLVDDSKIHNVALKEFLGFKVKDCYTAESAKEAYQILHNRSIDCIILDMYLPDADGKEVLNSLHNDPDKKDIPVIIYTGKSLSQKEQKELSKYATAIVQKNVHSYRIIMDKVTSIISK